MTGSQNDYHWHLRIIKNLGILVLNGNLFMYIPKNYLIFQFLFYYYITSLNFIQELKLELKIKFQK